MQSFTLNSLLRTHVAARGAQTALQCGNDSLSYAELNARATRVANALAAHGVRPGERVAYLGKNSLAYFEFLLGAMKAQAVTVPINWRLAEPEVRYVVENAQPRVLLVESPFESVATAAAPVVTRKVIGGQANDYATWRDSYGTQEPLHPKDCDQPLLQLYTSGTTGRPKGAVLSHHGLLRLNPQADPAWFRWSSEDRSLIAMPIAHVSGTGWAIWILQHGATGIIVREFEPQGVIDLLVRHRINKIMLVPTAMRIAVRHPAARGVDFGFLRYIYYGGAPLSPDLLRECAEVFHCGFVQMYGMTETSGTIVALAPEDHDVAQTMRLLSVGKPLAGVELKIVDGTGREVPPGVTGEIITRSHANMLGYFDMPTATAETLDKEGWLRTGDAGYIDPAGYLYLQDRVKDIIISGGENIYPTEVENAICGHPDVAEVAVIAVPDETWGEAVKAIIVPRPGASPSAAGIRAWAAERIARYKLPKSIAIVSSLPRGHTGKILRRQLRDAYRSGS